MTSLRFSRRALRVLVADDDRRMRETIGRALETHGGFEIVALVADADEAVSAAVVTLPDIALLDVNMPGGGGPVAARGIADASPKTVIVAISALGHAAAVRAMLDAGASTYAVKGTPLPELVEILESVMPRQRPSPAERVSDPVSVLVAEHDPKLLALLAEVVDRSPELELAGLAQTPYHAVTLAARNRPDVALLDLGMPGGGGARVAAEIRSCSDATRVITFTGPAAGESILGTPGEELVQAVVGAHRGGSPLADEVAAVLLRELASGEVSGGGSALDDVRRRRIERVLNAQDLKMHFQPIASLADKHAIGYEALAFFRDSPPRTPDVWFAEAVTVGLGVDLELLAITGALKHLAALPADTFLSLNASPEVAVSPDLRELLEGVEDRVVIEITEHAPVPDYEALVDGLALLRGRGVRLAVDDCGAGFASLRHVLLLAPDFIKLDIALCRDVQHPLRRALARALVSFAAEIDCGVIAEGIETPEDLAALRSLGVELGQGFHLGRPAELEQLIGR